VLELRPICEHCAKDLPPAATDAMICSFECTFCADCVEGVLLGVCPNCGGDFVRRPIRPMRDWRGGNFLGAFPPTTARRHRPVEAEAHALFAGRLGGIAPHER
jgi:hypothetical protein